jgi:LacI family transcriptional regulator
MIALKDLAQKLDVSISTVSKALNGSSEISQLTVDRVKALAKQLNYQPNKIALSLKNNKTKIIGVLIPSILNRFFAKVLLGIEEEATKNGFNIITCITNESLQKEKESLELLANGSVDGFILAVSEETQLCESFSHFDAIKNANIPMVMFDRVIDDFPCDKVIIDDYDAAKTATQKLISNGRENIAFITTINDLNVGKLRKKGYEETIKQKDQFQSLILEIDSNFDLQRQIESFLNTNPSIDGVIAADNISGTTCISVAKNLGYAIPKAIAVIGFADEAISNLSVPKLSYIHQDAEKIGASAIKMLVNRINKSGDLDLYQTQEIPITFCNKESI